jgi:rare lipoprotein A
MRNDVSYGLFRRFSVFYHDDYRGEIMGAILVGWSRRDKARNALETSDLNFQYLPPVHTLTINYEGKRDGGGYVLPRYRFAQLLWVMLLMCGLFVALSDRAEAEEALASWYGPGLDGKMTSSGQPFNADGLTAAHQALPMGTDLIVSYGGKSVPVTVNDRGPYYGQRELDLSEGAAKALGFIKPGVDYVDVTCVNGGIYPNCIPESTTPTTPQDGLGVEKAAPSTAVQDGTALQNGTTVQSTPTLQDTAPTLQDGTTLPDTTTLQDSTTIQDGTTLPDVTPMQDATTLQDGTTFQDGTTLQDSTNIQDEAGGGVHVVQPGETLSGIAAQLGTSADYLSLHNGITDPNLINAGQTLFF